MTNRLKGCTVLFEGNFREDDLAPLLDAIRQLRGVASVTGVVGNADDWMNREAVRREMAQRLRDALAREGGGEW